MNRLTILEVGPPREVLTTSPFLRLDYNIIKSHQIPRVGEYIRIHQTDIPDGWFIVRQVGYTYSSYRDKLDFDVLLTVEATEGGFLPHVKEGISLKYSLEKSLKRDETATGGREESQNKKEVIK